MNINQNSNWAIVGGGILGMYLAYRLTQRGERVTLFESRPSLGGLVDGWEHGEIRWDRFYHVIAHGDQQLLDLLREFHMADAVVWKTTRTGIHLDGAVQPFSGAADFLRLGGLTWWEKLRFAASIVAGGYTKCERMGERSASEWLIGIAGDRVFARIWAPLLRAKFGAHAESLPARHLCQILRRLFGARRGGAKQEFFGYLPGGYGVLLHEMTRRLASMGCELVTEAAIARIERDASGALAIRLAGQTRRFDRVIVTANDRVASALLHELPDVDATRLVSRQRLGVVCTSLLLKRSPVPYYITNLTNETPLTGVINLSALTGTDAYGGNHLVYLPHYDLSENIETINDLPAYEAHLVRAFLALFSGIDETDIVLRRTAKANYIFALDARPPAGSDEYRIGAGVYFVSSSRIGCGTLNVNETLRLADNALREIESAQT